VVSNANPKQIILCVCVYKYEDTLYIIKIVMVVAVANVVVVIIIINSTGASIPTLIKAFLITNLVS
jgi:hypothetical protein